MQRLNKIVEATIPPSNLHDLWLDRGALKQYNPNVGWEPVSDFISNERTYFTEDHVTIKARTYTSLTLGNNYNHSVLLVDFEKSYNLTSKSLGVITSKLVVEVPYGNNSTTLRISGLRDYLLDPGYTYVFIFTFGTQIEISATYTVAIPKKENSDTPAYDESTVAGQIQCGKYLVICGIKQDILNDWESLLAKYTHRVHDLGQDGDLNSIAAISIHQDALEGRDTITSPNGALILSWDPDISSNMHIKALEANSVFIAFPDRVKSICNSYLNFTTKYHHLLGLGDPGSSTDYYIHTAVGNNCQRVNNCIIYASSGVMLNFNAVINVTGLSVYTGGYVYCNFPNITTLEMFYDPEEVGPNGRVYLGLDLNTLIGPNNSVASNMKYYFFGDVPETIEGDMPIPSTLLNMIRVPQDKVENYVIALGTPQDDAGEDTSYKTHSLTWSQHQNNWNNGIADK